MFGIGILELIILALIPAGIALAVVLATRGRGETRDGD